MEGSGNVGLSRSQELASLNWSMNFRQGFSLYRPQLHIPTICD